ARVTCPGCGRSARIPDPRAAQTPAPPAPSPPVSPPAIVAEEQVKLQEISAIEEVKLQDLPVSPMEIEVEEAEDVPELVEDDTETSYGLGDEDELAGVLPTSAGVYATLGLINLEVPATCIAYGARGAWALAEQGSNVLVVNMKTNKRKAYFK